MKYTRIPQNTFKEIQMNAGILASDFNPETGEVKEADLFGATTGGLSFSDSMSFKDLGEDIDNCPKNMMELKMLENHEVKISGTFVTMNAKTAHLLAAAADVDADDDTHIIPRNDVLLTDYTDIWVIGDYSDVNEDTAEKSAGFIAIHLMNALNTGGFQIKTADKAKGQFSFEFTGHYSMDAQDTVPFELYVKLGGDAPAPTTPSVTLDKDTLALTVSGDSATLAATTVPAGQTVTWTSSDENVATVAAGVVSPEGAGTATITATITVDGQTYTDTCAVTVTA